MRRGLGGLGGHFCSDSTKNPNPSPSPSHHLAPWRSPPGSIFCVTANFLLPRLHLGLAHLHPLSVASARHCGIAGASPSGTESQPSANRCSIRLVVPQKNPATGTTRQGVALPLARLADLLFLSHYASMHVRRPTPRTGLRDLSPGGDSATCGSPHM